MPPLGFCSNLLPAESLVGLLSEVIPFAVSVRERLGWDRLGLDLRLGNQALTDGRCDGWDGVRRALDRARLSAHTLNGFPLRPFQAPRVKEQAYLPDWSESERLERSLDLLHAALALSDEPELTISTVPGAFRWDGAGTLAARCDGPVRTDAAVIARNLGRWAAAAARVQRDTGRRVVLALEPEPWCLLEHSHDAAWFWTGALAREGVAAAIADLDGDRASGAEAVRRHLGLCLDTCHGSLAFEEPAEALARLTAAGVPIVKCQITNAPEVRDPTRNPAGVAALRALAEPRFLHQTAARSAAGSWSRAVDLDGLDQMLARLPDATAIRSHFHVPLNRVALAEGLGTTRADTVRWVDAACAAGCQHLSVETYTWPLLNGGRADIRAGTVAELHSAQALLPAGHG